MSTLVIMPTIPGRSAKDVIETFLRQGVDLRVYLNGFESAAIPVDWPVQQDPISDGQEMRFLLSKQRRGPAIRYSEPVDGYDYVCFVDDDLVYPKDYIETSIAHLEKLGSNVAVTWNGSYWPKTTESFKGRHGFPVVAESVKYWRVPYTGSGALVMRAEDFNALAGPVPSLFEFEDDIWISSRLAAKGIDLIRPPSEKRWIDVVWPESTGSLWKSAIADGFRKRDVALRAAREDCPMWDLNDWHGFYKPEDPRR